jgi:hypothetical protein
MSNCITGGNASSPWGLARFFRGIDQSSNNLVTGY